MTICSVSLQSNAREQKLSEIKPTEQQLVAGYTIYNTFLQYNLDGFQLNYDLVLPKETLVGDKFQFDKEGFKTLLEINENYMHLIKLQDKQINLFIQMYTILENYDKWIQSCDSAFNQSQEEVKVLRTISDTQEKQMKSEKNKANSLIRKQKIKTILFAIGGGLVGFGAGALTFKLVR